MEIPLEPEALERLALDRSLPAVEMSPIRAKPALMVFDPAWIPTPPTTNEN